MTSSLRICYCFQVLGGFPLEGDEGVDVFESTPYL